MALFASLFAMYTAHAGHPGLAMVATATLVGALGGALSLIVHEFGHVHASRKVAGVRAVSVSVISLGAATHLEGAYKSARDQIRVAVGGPLASFALAVPLLGAIALPIPTSLRWAAFLLAGLNVGLGLAALVPIHPLDGHKVVVGLMWALVKSESRARTIIRRCGFALMAVDLAVGSTLLVERPKLGCAVALAAAAMFADKRFARLRRRRLED